MKNFLFTLFISFSTLLSFSAHAQRVPVIQDFSSIQLNEDETITATPYHSGMSCWGDNCGNKITLKKGEKYSFSDGHHAYGSVTYKGVKDNQLVFEIMSGFDAISFGGDVSEDKKEKMVFPYTKEQFSEGREKEILERIEFNGENKSEIARLIKKLGIANELLWIKYHDLSYVKFLVENGADINYTNENGETILFPILVNNRGFDRPTIRDRICSKEARELQALISLGIDVHHLDNKNKEVLNYISEKIQKCNDVKENQDMQYECFCLPVFEQILKGNPNPLDADKEICNNLPYFEFITDKWHRKSYCVPRCFDGQFRGDGDACCSCNDKYGRYVSLIEECNKCPNRSVKEHNPYNIECVRDYMFCPEGMIKSTFMGDEKCVSCEATIGIDTTQEECAKCPHRVFSKTPYGSKCILQKCPEGMFLAYGSMCQPCDDIGSFNLTDKKDCLKCPNRIIYKGEVEYCAPKECPEGTFRSLKFGSCVSCDESNDTHVGLDATLEECNKCFDRELVGTRCSLKTCPEGRFRASDGTCPSCNWDGDFETTEEQCSKCLSRIYKNGKCSLR